MNGMFELALSNLTSPVILFFALGIMLALIKAKVEIPNAIGEFITIYLLVAIGLKGGVAIADAGVLTVLPAIIGAIFVSMLVPIYSYFALKKIGKFNIDDAAAVAGHYGSVSVVTFIAAGTFLQNQQISYEPFVNGLPAIMEVPAIIVALVIASIAKTNRSKKEIVQANERARSTSSVASIAKQVMLSKSVVLLLGAMLVGFLSGPQGMAQVEFFYHGIFMGMLSLFMLEMGIVTAGKLKDLKKAGIFLVGFGVFVPIISSLLGITVGALVGLSVGGATLLGVLAASSSYIVAPAAMRISLPKANPALYLGASLGVTLPFNLIFGIPLYYYFASIIV